jgi:hypothetical protein
VPPDGLDRGHQARLRRALPAQRGGAARASHREEARH